MYDCRVVNIPCAVGQFIHCAGACHFDCACLDVPCRSVDGDLAARRNLSAGSVYDDFLVSRAEGYFITQSDGVFFSACLCTEPFRNGYIGIFRFDGRRFCRTADGRVQLIHIDGICPGRTFLYVGDLLVVRIETVFVDIGLSVDGQAAVSTQIDIFLQLHIELCSVRYDADIVICQVCRGTALNFQLFSQLFINICAGVSAEVQAFFNGIVNVCNICCIRILLRFGCDICQGNLFLIAFVVRYGQHHISVAVRFVLALASCCRICYQMVIFLCHLGEYFAQVYIDFARIIPFQCQGFAVIGNTACCDIIVFESRYIGSQVVRTGQRSRAVAVCLVICGTACHILVFCFDNTVDIADISRVRYRISAAGYVRDLLVPCVDAGVVDLYVTYGQAAVRTEIHIFFQVVFYSRYLSGRIFCHGSRCICSIGKVDFTAVLYLIHIAVVLLYRPGNTACRIGCRRFQLGHIDGIGIIRAGRHIDDLAFYRIRADTDGTCRSFCRINGIYLRCAGTGRNIRIGRSYIPCRRPAGMAVGNTVRAERHAAVHFGIGIRSQNGRILPGSLRRRTHDGGILACPRRCRPDTDSDDMSLIAIIRLRILADYNRGYAFGGGIQADSYAAGIRGRVHTCFLAQSDAAFITAGAAFCTDSQSAVITGTQHFSLVTDGSPFLGTVYGTFRTDSYTALCG